MLRGAQQMWRLDNIGGVAHGPTDMLAVGTKTQHLRGRRGGGFEAHIST